MVSFTKSCDRITSDLSRLGAVRQDNNMICARDHGLFNIRIERIHGRESALQAEPVDTDERDFRRHRLDHLDRRRANDGVLDLANDSAHDRAIPISFVVMCASKSRGKLFAKAQVVVPESMKT